jgi:YegS/Rv2252/BmrU family lipid kinase
MSRNFFLFVINPKSGNTDKEGLENLIEISCNKNKLKYTILYTTGENDKQKIEEEISNLNPDVVIACGGDGTVNLIADIIKGSDILLGIIPLGSANGLAAELEIPEDIEQSLEIVMRKKATATDVLIINKEFISLHLSDVGFNAKMIRDFEKSGDRGNLAYAKSFFSSLKDKKATFFTLEVDGKSIEIVAEMIVFANASSYGTGAVINPDSSMSDGIFEIIVFKPIPLGDLVSLSFSSFFGDINNSEFVTIYPAQSAKIICHEKELLQVDGELKGEVDEITLGIKKGAINVIAPSTY